MYKWHFQNIAKNALYTIQFDILLLSFLQFVTTSHKIRPHVYLFLCNTFLFADQQQYIEYFRFF